MIKAIKTTKDSFPKAILHIDGDSFFASCEVAKNPALKGKPVVTGLERGIASSMTYEAKAAGVKRGMAIFQIKKVCPHAIILPSDYETYSLYSHRMYDIVRRYTPDVEEYSIDECFADLTGLEKLHKMSYGEIAAKIKDELEVELGMTFSIGVGVNKVTAKIGSKWKKPNELTIISLFDISKFLETIPVEKLWGIGRSTSRLLNNLGVYTAGDFASLSHKYVLSKLAKPYEEIWLELQGKYILSLNLEFKDNYKSISKTRTFTPPSSDEEFVFSQLSKNIENACIKLRRYDLKTPEVYFYLKTQEFKYNGLEIKLKEPTNNPREIVRAVMLAFPLIFRKNTLYRATGIFLLKLSQRENYNMSLFEDAVTASDINILYEGIDKLSEKYGKHTVFLGSSLSAMNAHQHEGDRGSLTSRKNNLFKGETARRRLNILSLGKVK